MTRICVLGAGSWGTAFSLVLADAGNDVTLWARREEVCDTINRRRENTDYLPGVELPAKVTATHDTERALADAEVVVFAVPSQTFRANLEEWAPYVPGSGVMVSLMKGVELGTLKRMSEVIGEVTDAGPERVAVVSGPNLSHEISQREPAASVVACADASVAQGLQRLVHSPAFRPYTSVDVVGCELGGAYKNVVALSVGMAVGLGFGNNTTASVITRGLAETARLAMAMDANPLTLMGLAGLGDLVATCSSPLSRNRTFGEKLGLGMTTEEIVASTRQVAEGAKSCSSLLALAEKVGVDAPIAEHVEAVVAGRMTAPEMMEAFLSRDTKAERDCSEQPRTRNECAVAASADSRSAQRSSTSSMPTLSRTRPSGIVAGSVFHRRRRSRVDSTPPSEVACTHREVDRVRRSAASAPPARTTDTMPPKPG